MVKDTDVQNTKTEDVSNDKKRKRAERKKVYNRAREMAIPADLKAYFAKDDWELRLVRWVLQGNEEYRNLYQREEEGYELVTIDEIPEDLRRGLKMEDTKTRKGLVTIGDLALAKVDSELRESRRKSFQEATDAENNAVDMHVLEKKGYRNLGSRSKVYKQEPKFQD